MSPLAYLEQVVITNEIEAREGLALLLQELSERLLTPLELVEDGFERLRKTVDAEKREDARIITHAIHDGDKFLVNHLEARFLVRQRATAKNGLEVNPFSYHPERLEPATLSSCRLNRVDTAGMLLCAHAGWD